MDTNDRRYYKGELAKEILFMIAAGAIIPASLILPNLPLILKPFLKSLSKKTKTSHQSVIKSLTYLKRERLVGVVEKNNEQILILSEDGRRRILKFNADKMTIRRPKKWDGYWRVVLFDIPEQEREGRDTLRSALKRLGFYQLQKSCFVHPFDCKDEVDFITELFHISHHTNFIIAKSIEGENILEDFFNL